MKRTRLSRKGRKVRSKRLNSLTKKEVDFLHKGIQKHKDNPERLHKFYHKHKKLFDRVGEVAVGTGGAGFLALTVLSPQTVAAIGIPVALGITAAMVGISLHRDDKVSKKK